MAGRAATPQGRTLSNINNMPNRRYLPSIKFLYLLQGEAIFMSQLTGLYHNVGPLRFGDDHHHSCISFAQVRIFGGKK
jgi:hypothetical protein